MKKISLLMILMLLSTTLYGYSKKIILQSFSKEENAKKSLSNYMKNDNYEKLDGLAKENDFKVYVRKSGKYYIVVIEAIYSKKLLAEVSKIVKQNYKHAYTSSYSPSKTSKKSQVEKKITQKATIVKPILKITTQEDKKITKVKKVDIVEKEKEVDIVAKQDKKIEVKKDKEKVYLVQDEKIKDLEIKKPKEIKKSQDVQGYIYSELDEMLKTIKEKAENFISSISIVDMIKYGILFIILSMIIFYFIKFKRIYDEY